MNPKAKSPWLILITVALGTLLVGLDRTVVNLALPDIITRFHISLSTAGWIATIYTITSAVFIPIFGKLSDVYGARKIYTIGFVGFVIVSVLTGLAWNIGSLIVLRAFQGLIGAAVYPTAMSLIADSFTDKEKRAEALGIWTSIIAGSALLGPLIGGPLIDHFTWRAVFYINLPIGVIGFIMIQSFLLPNVYGEKQRFDIKGTIFMAGTLIGLLLALDRGVLWGWFSTPEIILYIVCIVCGIIFYFSERNLPHALVDLNILRNRNLMSVLFAAFISYGILFGFMVLINIFVQDILHFSATANGYMLLPLLIGVMLFSPIGGRLAKRFAPRWTVVGGLLISAVGIFLTPAGSDATVWSMIVPLALVGIGLGITSAPISSATTSSVPHSEIGMASALLNLCRNIGGAFGIALYTILLSLHWPYHTLFIVGGAVMAFGALVASGLKGRTDDYSPQNENHVTIDA
jgi:EmrB/QacA subfamily drug resistance transporter